MTEPYYNQQSISSRRSAHFVIESNIDDSSPLEVAGLHLKEDAGKVFATFQHDANDHLFIKTGSIPGQPHHDIVFATGGIGFAQGQASIPNYVYQEPIERLRITESSIDFSGMDITLDTGQAINFNSTETEYRLGLDLGFSDGREFLIGARLQMIVNNKASDGFQIYNDAGEVLYEQGGVRTSSGAWFHNETVSVYSPDEAAAANFRVWCPAGDNTIHQSNLQLCGKSNGSFPDTCWYVSSDASNGEDTQPDLAIGFGAGFALPGSDDFIRCRVAEDDIFVYKDVMVDANTSIQLDPTSEIGFGSLLDFLRLRVYGGSAPAAADIAAITGGSAFGSVIEGRVIGHAVMGVRGNDDSDAFSVIRTNNWGGDLDYSSGTLSMQLRGDYSYFGAPLVHVGVDAGSSFVVSIETFVRVTADGIAVGLPTTPLAGRKVVVHAALGSVSTGITINAGGSDTIEDNVITSHTLTLPWEHVTLEYNGDGIWLIT